jgi:hypothetical protein
MIWQIASGVNVAGAPHRGASLSRRHPGGWRRIEPPAAPVTGRLAPDPELFGGLANPYAGCGQQNDARPFRQFLWRRMRPHQAVQFAFMLSRQLYR